MSLRGILYSNIITKHQWSILPLQSVSIATQSALPLSIYIEVSWSPPKICSTYITFCERKIGHSIFIISILWTRIQQKRFGSSPAARTVSVYDGKMIHRKHIIPYFKHYAYSCLQIGFLNLFIHLSTENVTTDFSFRIFLRCPASWFANDIVFATCPYPYSSYSFAEQEFLRIIRSIPQWCVFNQQHNIFWSSQFELHCQNFKIGDNYIKSTERSKKRPFGCFLLTDDSTLEVCAFCITNLPFCSQRFA